MATREELEEAILHGSSADKAAAGAAAAAAAGAWAANGQLRDLNQQAQLTNQQLDMLNRTSSQQLAATSQGVQELRKLNTRVDQVVDELKEMKEEQRRANFIRWKNHDREGQFYARWESDAKFLLQMITSNSEAMEKARRKDLQDLAFGYAANDPTMLEINDPKHTSEYKPDAADMKSIQEGDSHSNPLRDKLLAISGISLVLVPICFLLRLFHVVMGELYGITGKLLWVFLLLAVVFFIAACLVKSNKYEKAAHEAQQREYKRQYEWDQIEHYTPQERDRRLAARFREIIEQVKQDAPSSLSWTDFDVDGYARQIAAAIESAPRLLPDPQDLPRLGNIYVMRDNPALATMPNMMRELGRLPDITHELKG